MPLQVIWFSFLGCLIFLPAVQLIIWVKIFWFICFWDELPWPFLWKPNFLLKLQFHFPSISGFLREIFLNFPLSLCFIVLEQWVLPLFSWEIPSSTLIQPHGSFSSHKFDFFVHSYRFSTIFIFTSISQVLLTLFVLIGIIRKYFTTKSIFFLKILPFILQFLELSSSTRIADFGTPSLSLNFLSLTPLIISLYHSYSPVILGVPQMPDKFEL